MKVTQSKLLVVLLIAGGMFSLVANGSVIQDPAYVQLDSDPIGAEIFLDGVPTGKVTPALVDLGQLPAFHVVGSASHVIALRNPGAPLPSPVSVMPAQMGETVDCLVDMTGQSTGAIYIDSDPQGADVFVNVMDAPIGVTPLLVEDLAAVSQSGGHKIVLRKSGYLIPRPVLAGVTVGQTNQVLVPLTADSEPDLEVTVSSDPSGATVYVDSLPTMSVSDVVLGGLDPASHAGSGWSSASHTLQLRGVWGYYPSAPQYIDPNGAGGQVVDLTLLQIPNEPPTITSASPVDSTVQQSQYSTATYAVTTEDLDSDPVVYRWRVDGVDQPSATGPSFAYAAGTGSAGTRTIQVEISGEYYPGADSQSWQVEVINLPPVLDSQSPSQSTATIEARGSQTFTVNAHDPEGQALSYRWLVDGTQRASGSQNFTYEPEASEAGARTVVCLVSDESHVDALSAAWTVDVENEISHPSIGTLTWLGGNVYNHPVFGMIAFANDGADLWFAWNFGLNTWLQIEADGQVFSDEYGYLEYGDNPNWLLSSYFGYCFFSPENRLSGWVWTSRFEWMRFDNSTGSSYLWVSKLEGWLAVLQGGNFYSFDYRWLFPQSLTEYRSDLFGTVTVGEPQGWIYSDYLGWMWGARGTNAKWFYTTAYGWVGVSDDGVNMWSVDQQRWLR